MASLAVQASLRGLCDVINECYLSTSEDLLNRLSAIIQNQKILRDETLSLQLKMLIQDGSAYSVQIEHSTKNAQVQNISAVAISVFRYNEEASFLRENKQTNWKRLEELPKKKRENLLQLSSNTASITLKAKKEGAALEACWRRIEQNYQKDQSRLPSYLSSLVVEEQQLENGVLLFKLIEITQGEYTYRPRVIYSKKEDSQDNSIIDVAMVGYNQHSSFLFTNRGIDWGKLDELPVGEEKILLEVEGAKKVTFLVEKLTR